MGKVLSVLIIIALALVCAAFWGLFDRFPDEWEWVGIIIAGIGLAMATPSLLQMFWGRANVETEFEEYSEKLERCLLVFFKNSPVKSRLLRILGVKRETVQSLTAEIRISESGSNKIIVPIRQSRIYSDDNTESGNNRIVLPPTHSMGANIVVAHWDNQLKKAIIPPDRRRKPLPLGEGSYRADILMIIDGEPRIISRLFIVGKDMDGLMWASKNSPTSHKESS
jgi:hypothetical protein